MNSQQHSSKKQKHLSLDDRIEIQKGLEMNMKFKAIARHIAKDPTTVSKEVKKRITIIPTDVKYSDAKGQPLTPPICEKLIRAPFVCNGCPNKRKKCGFNKQLYYADKAHDRYQSILSESREGIALNKEAFYDMDELISRGINQGQRLYHISKTHKLPYSKSTIYRHLHNGYLTVSPIDFPRVVKFKSRKKRSTLPVPQAARENRTYTDFLTFLEEHDQNDWLEMDTVIGRIGGKVLVTLHHSYTNFMFALLIENKSANTLGHAIYQLKQSLHDHDVMFSDIFPVILTDNGGEFALANLIEKDVEGDTRSHLFYCDPNRPDQKGRIEKNHTLLRDIVPKGTSLDNMTQDDINIILSHVNSIKRKKFNGRSPYEMFSFTYSDELASLLGIEKIHAELVNQSQTLLKQLNISI